MKKIITLIVFILSTLFISGCGITESPEALTKPPRLEGDKEDIKDAIKEYLPQNTKPIIPPIDDNGSYIKLQDLDGDDEDEALVFYTLEQDENPIRILVLKKKESEWINIAEIKVVGQDLEQVEFKDLDGDGGQEIIIGSRKKYALDKDLSIYSIKNNELELSFNRSYDEIIIDDLNEDKMTELMLLKLDRESDESYGELYKHLEGEMKEIDKIYFNENAEISHASYDYIYKNTKGIIISTIIEEETVNTYMMKVKDDKLVNLLENSLIQNEKQINAETLIPRDIDEDGIIEFALPNKLQENSKEELINWVTGWYAYDGKGSIALKKLNYYDEKLNFTFDFPLKWKDKLTITNLTKNENTIKQEEYIKVEYKSSGEAYKTHLFTVYVYDKDKLKRSDDNEVSEDYKKILEDSNRIYYMYRNNEINENTLTLIDEEIKKIEKTFKFLES